MSVLPSPSIFIRKKDSRAQAVGAREEIVHASNSPVIISFTHSASGYQRPLYTSLYIPVYQHGAGLRKYMREKRHTHSPRIYFILQQESKILNNYVH